jgi:hypothetical protein
MIAAINEGVRQGVFTLKPDGRETDAQYGFDFHGHKALAHAQDAGFDEIRINVQLNPTEAGRKFIKTIYFGDSWQKFGDAFASGWLERQEGQYLQTTGASPMLYVRRTVLPLLTSVRIKPEGYADYGKCRL